MILELVTLAHRQLRVGGMGGAYGLDWNVLARIADDAGIRTDPQWWGLVESAEAELMAALNPPKPGNAPPEE